jgi:NACHT domain/Restriction endonuclease
MKGQPPSVSLERRISALYGILGFETQHDVLLQGNQVDVVATYRVPGAPAVRLAIEAKWVESPTSRVSKDTVAQYLPTARNLLSAELCTAVVIVTNRAFTRFAKELVRDEPQIELLTIEDLERQLIFGSPQLGRHSAVYWTSPIGRLFVEPNVRWVADLEGTEGLSDPFRGSELVNEATEDPHGPIILSADYGAGKSTLLERIKHIALRDLIQSARTVLPLVFYLKEFNVSGSVEDLIQATCIRELGRDFGTDAFWELLDQGKLLLLLDGFDEMAGAPTAKERVTLLSHLSPLLFGRSPAILSTRPAYFTSRRDLDSAIRKAAQAGGVLGKHNRRRELLGADGRRVIAHLRETAAPRGSYMQFGEPYRLAELMPLSSSSISEYLHRFDDQWAATGFGDGDSVQQFLGGIYDLSDLLTRPLLLSMIVEMLLEGFLGLDEPQSLGPAQLYEIYTEMKLITDFDKGGARSAGALGPDRRAFAEGCAVAMLQGGRLELDPAEAATIAGSIGGYKNSHEQLLTDFRTCSFLTVTPGGHYKFVHKSFYEFFLACRIFDAIGTEDWQLLGLEAPAEALMFVGSMLQLKPIRARKLLELLRRLSEKGATVAGASAAQVGANLVSAALWGSIDIKDVSLKDLAIPPSDFTNVALVDVRLANTAFEGVVGQSLELYPAGSLDVKFGNASIENLLLGPCDRGAMAFASSSVEVFDVAESTLSTRLSESTVERMSLGEESAVTLQGTDGMVGRLDLASSSVMVFRGVGVDLLASRDSTIRFDDATPRRLDVARSCVVTDASNLSGVMLASGAIRFSLVVVRGQGRQQALGRPNLEFEKCLFLFESTTSLQPLSGMRLARCCIVGGELKLEARRGKASNRDRINKMAYDLPALVGTVVADSSGGADETESIVDVDEANLKLTVLNPNASVAKKLLPELRAVAAAVTGRPRPEWRAAIEGLANGLRESPAYCGTVDWVDEWLATMGSSQG